MPLAAEMTWVMLLEVSCQGTFSGQRHVADVEVASFELIKNVRAYYLVLVTSPNPTYQKLQITNCSF
jgi:hypothetical protein